MINFMALPEVYVDNICRILCVRLRKDGGRGVSKT